MLSLHRVGEANGRKKSRKQWNPNAEEAVCGAAHNAQSGADLTNLPLKAKRSESRGKIFRIEKLPHTKKCRNFTNFDSHSVKKKPTLLGVVAYCPLLCCNTPINTQGPPGQRQARLVSCIVLPSNHLPTPFPPSLNPI